MYVKTKICNKFTNKKKFPLIFIHNIDKFLLIKLLFIK